MSNRIASFLIVALSLAINFIMFNFIVPALLSMNYPANTAGVLIVTSMVLVDMYLFGLVLEQLFKER